jgi:hypothetical protein
MLKAKKRYILPVLGLKKSFKSVSKSMTQNFRLLLICKSIFNITISGIPYKCSHFVEIENLKII